MLVTTKQIWRSWLKEEQNLVKTFGLSDEIRTEGDHGSHGYLKKDMFTHRFREIHAFRTLDLKKGFFLPQDHQSITWTSKRILNAETVLGQRSRRATFRFFDIFFECGPHLVDSR